MNAWNETARKLADGTGEAPAGWDVVRGERPPLIDAEATRALLAPMVAIVAWAGAYFREMIAGTPSDGLALLMRLIALAMTVRAVYFVHRLARRIATWRAAPRCALVLAPEGLWARLPDGEVHADREEIVGITEHGTWQTRSAGRRYSPVYVALLSPLRTHIELPPIFEATPGVLAERLMRWRGGLVPEERPPFPKPAQLASKVYDDAARGIREPGTTVIRHGNGWLRRGPWATVLLGVAIVEGWLRADAESRAVLGGFVLPIAAVAFALAPLVWIALTRREVRPRLGMAMVLTPAEMLLRARGGVLRVGWANLQRTSIDARGRFSILEGWAYERALEIKRKDGPPIRYDEAFLGVPAEVALTLCDAYANGTVQAALERSGHDLQPSA